MLLYLRLNLKHRMNHLESSSGIQRWFYTETYASLLLLIAKLSLHICKDKIFVWNSMQLRVRDIKRKLSNLHFGFFFVFFSFFISYQSKIPSRLLLLYSKRFQKFFFLWDISTFEKKTKRKKETFSAFPHPYSHFLIIILEGEEEKNIIGKVRSNKKFRQKYFFFSKNAIHICGSSKELPPLPRSLPSTSSFQFNSTKL